MTTAENNTPDDRGTHQFDIDYQALNPTILDDPNRIGAQVGWPEWAERPDRERAGDQPEESDAFARFDDFMAHLVDWFRQHGAVPVPKHFSMHVQVPAAQLAELAQEFGCTLYGDRPQFSLPLNAYGHTAYVIAYMPSEDHRPL